MIEIHIFDNDRVVIAELGSALSASELKQILVNTQAFVKGELEIIYLNADGCRIIFREWGKNLPECND